MSDGEDNNQSYGFTEGKSEEDILNSEEDQVKNEDFE